MSFETDYERMVWPLLEARARVEGTAVIVGDQTFSRALDALASLARARGGSHVPNWPVMEERLARTLLAEIGRADAIYRNVEAFRTARPSAFWKRIWG
jgi:hypothetical protein